MIIPPAVRTALILLGLATFVGLVAGAQIASRQPTRTQASLSFAVNRRSTVASAEYQYDGYYAIQAADLFSQTVVSWFSTPPVLREIYAAAGVDTAGDTANDLTKHFKVRKVAAQNIVVTITESDRPRVERLAAATTETMQVRAAALNQTADQTALFEIVGTEPLFAAVQPDARLWALGGALVGFLAGLSALSLRAYFISLSTPHAGRD